MSNTLRNIVWCVTIIFLIFLIPSNTINGIIVTVTTTTITTTTLTSTQTITTTGIDTTITTTTTTTVGTFQTIITPTTTTLTTTTVLTSPGGWRSQTIATTADEIRGIAVGDVDPDNPGNEVVVISGCVATMIYQDGASWKTVEIFRNPTYPETGVTYILNDVVIGEFYPPNPGKEMIIVDEWSVYIVYKSGAEWKYERILTFVKSKDISPPGLRAAAIGDFDSMHPGNEVVVVGNCGKVTMILYDNGWGSGTIWEWKDMDILDVAVGDFDSKNPGEEIDVLLYPRKVAIEIYGKSGSWNIANAFMHPDECLLNVVAYITMRGSGYLLFGGNSPKVYASSEREREELIFTEPDGWAISGIAAGEFDPNHRGTEIAICSRKVYEVHKIGETWHNTLIFSDVARIYGVAIGDFDKNHDGNEVVVGGSSRKVTEIYKVILPEPPDRWGIVLGAKPGLSAINHTKDVEAIYTLLKSLGYDDEHIFCSGPEEFPGVDRLISLDNIFWAINEVAMKSDVNDVVFFYIVGHGNTDIINIEGNIEGELHLDANVLDEWLDEISCSKMIIVLEACRSGSFIDDLAEGERNRVIVTSSAANKDCMGFPSGSIFTMDFVKAFKESASNGLNGDKNNDGKVSVGEAYQYAKESTPWHTFLANPQLEDTELDAYNVYIGG